MASAITPIRDVPYDVDQSERYRLVIFDDTGTRLLLTNTDGKLALPEVAVPKFTRIVEKITSTVQERWDITTSLLKLDCAPSAPQGHFYAALEAPRNCGVIPGLTKHSVLDALAVLPDDGDISFLSTSHSSAMARPSGNDVGPFTRLGWKYDVENWVRQVSGLEPVSIRQLSGSDDTALIRFETATRSLWLKAVGQSSAQEFAHTVQLAEWFPTYLPAIVSLNSSWTAWLMESGGETNLRECTELDTWVMVAGRLAELQIKSICRATEFLGMNCVDLRLSTLQALVDPFFEFMGDLMERQTTNPPAPLTTRELSEIAVILREAISELSRLNLPDVIGHSDFNPGNILIGEQNCVFIDWAAAHVGNPTLTFEYLVAHFRKSHPTDSELGHRLRYEYKQHWLAYLSAHSAEQLDRALEFARLVAVFASAIASNSWRTPALLARPGIAGYLRSLARIMKKEASRLNGGSLRDSFPHPPESEINPVTEIIHETPVTDPYRWLEDQDSPLTRQWLRAQSAFAREYLDGLPARASIKTQIRAFLEIETYDTLLVEGGRYFFRKRLPRQEQPSIYTRDANGQDQLLVDPADLNVSNHTAVKPLAVSPNGKILAYEVKEGGQRASRVELLDIASSTRLPDGLPLAYLRAFSFAPDSQSFYYVQDSLRQSEASIQAIYQHELGTSLKDDRVLFDAGTIKDVRLTFVSGGIHLLIMIQRFVPTRITDCYVHIVGSGLPAKQVLTGNDLSSIQIVNDRFFLLTRQDSPNYRVVELCLGANGNHEFRDIVAARDHMIWHWIAFQSYIVVSYVEGTSFRVLVFDLFGRQIGEIPVHNDESVRLIAGDQKNEEVLFETESFLLSPAIHRYSIPNNKRIPWNRPAISLDKETYNHRQAWYESKDGTRIPIFLVGKREVLDRNDNPVILTSYGGFRHPMTPQFSVLVAFLMSVGCVFALPAIRGGSEFGAEWHEAARRQKRQIAFDDFLSAAGWLIDTGIAARDKIAIFGGSNSGLLVGVAMTQAPELFRAVLCISPLLDMIRYHLVDGAVKWKEEFGTADNADDFRVLWSYSPYHCIVRNTQYPAVMMVSGDSDQTCNPFHARKMVARLQATNTSPRPIILDYSQYRGHAPVLPLSTRVEALSDRVAFLCDQLTLTV
ncbi:MAG: prolyl oligopeptidase [Candidatus Sulfotelmatobacter sp.]|nr:prolyl oligopeptidase [Candidatus Sulfotelmatobacter sp.]